MKGTNQMKKHKSKLNKKINEMFQFELINHEYGYTHELDDTIEALDLTKKQIRENKALKNGLLLAINTIDTE